MSMIFSTSREADATTLRIEGALDALTAPEIRPALDELVAARHAKVLVDVARVTFIDSSGVAVIVSLYKRSRAHGGNVVVVGAKDQPLAVFRLLRMDRVLFG